MLAARGGSDGWIAKYSSAAPVTHLWSKRLGGEGNDYACGVKVSNAGVVYAVGAFDSPSGVASFGGPSHLSASSDVFVAAYDNNTSSGTFQWDAQLGGSAADTGLAVAVNAAGAPVLT